MVIKVTCQSFIPLCENLAPFFSKPRPAIRVRVPTLCAASNRIIQTSFRLYISSRQGSVILEIRPLYLLADSQLLFLGQDKNSLTRRLQQDLPENPKAAYIGASNDYQSQFYDLFLAAMDLIAV